ncbi:MAG: hypothetical protein QNJ55_22480 [Xenococcus sp. MO_188.B8]|nr:hypothetical protein [Xenococcus sp. MO_188.B8]
MKVITTQRNVNPENLAVNISSWLNDRNWDTDTKRAGNSIWKVIATKGGLVRDFLCTRGKINISITKRASTTEIKIDDRSFNENWAANAAWVAATGGTNLLLTAAGKIGAHNLTQYIESLI